LAGDAWAERARCDPLAEARSPADAFLEPLACVVEGARVAGEGAAVPCSDPPDAFPPGAAGFLAGAACFLAEAPCLLAGAACFLAGAACFLAGAVCFLAGAVCFLAGAACFLAGPACFLAGAPPFWVKAVCLLAGPACFLAARLAGERSSGASWSDRPPDVAPDPSSCFEDRAPWPVRCDRPVSPPSGACPSLEGRRSPASPVPEVEVA
jgi:hypothetical protein